MNIQIMNIFEKSKKLIENINNPNKNYWESNPVTWDNNVLGPDGQQYDESALCEVIKESDRQRLIKFG